MQRLCMALARVETVGAGLGSYPSIQILSLMFCATFRRQLGFP